MNMVISIRNENYVGIEKQVGRECKKLDKYFLVKPKIDCRILTFKKGVHVKILLNTETKHFCGEAYGMQINVCINKAVKKLMRLINTDKELQLPQKNHALFNANLLNEREVLMSF